MPGDSWGAGTTFLFGSQAAFSQQVGSQGKGYSDQGDESKVPTGSWGWPEPRFKADEFQPINISVPYLASCPPAQ